VRTAIRAIVLDARDRVLLAHVREREQGLFWLTPGGGVESGEEGFEPFDCGV
jgi:8-oxo-dGTP pyrophosphatase MutT (NUDIX family)